MMRFTPMLLFLGAALLAAGCIHDEIRGATAVRGGTISSRNILTGEPNPDFRGTMSGKWMLTLGILLAGSIGRGLQRHYDRHDPLSPEFDSDGGERKAGT